jgi:hypothetical protein
MKPSKSIGLCIESVECLILYRCKFNILLKFNDFKHRQNYIPHLLKHLTILHTARSARSARSVHSVHSVHLRVIYVILTIITVYFHEQH